MKRPEASKEELLETYLLRHITPEPPILQELHREANVRLLYPRMMSGHLQGRLLSILSSLCKHPFIVEIGSFTGYATLALAEGLAPEACLHTIEINDEMEDFLRHYIKKSGKESQIKLHIGDALDILPQLPIEETGLLFIDANKRFYKTYLDMVKDRLPIGAIILSDNTLWDGKVLDETVNDSQTLAIKEYNDYLVSLEMFETVILPMRDGLSMSIKKAK